MTRRTCFALLLLPALVVCAGVVLGPVSRAEALSQAAVDKKKADADKKKKAEAEKTRKAAVAKMKADITRSGKLAGGAKGVTYWQRAAVLHPGTKRTFAALQLKTMPAKGGKAAALTGPGKGSSLTTVGGVGLPPGFGTGFSWDRVDNEVIVVMFINAADPLGISIDGVEAGDKVQVLSASGVASFSESTLKKAVPSLIGLVAAGVKVAKPEAAPAIDAAEKAAKELFNSKNVKTKVRDAFGVDPGNGGKAQQEGGVLVCLPEGGGTYYSGRDRVRWVKSDGTRTDKNLPAHVYGSFFPMQGEPVHNTRMAKQSGPMYVTAWDHAFDDNAGYYKVFVKLTKGTGLPPIILEKKTGSAAKPKK